MGSNRVLVLGLDGYETRLGEQMMAAGELPALAALRERTARLLLDHGAAQRTGLAWEHVASGLSPEDARAGQPLASIRPPTRCGMRAQPSPHFPRA